jgi:hypothetical protein
MHGLWTQSKQDESRCKKEVNFTFFVCGTALFFSLYFGWLASIQVAMRGESEMKKTTNKQRRVKKTQLPECLFHREVCHLWPLLVQTHKVESHLIGPRWLCFLLLAQTVHQSALIDELGV